MLKLRSASLVFIITISSIFAQVQRNPVLEYATGTWCGWCACSHQLIADSILPLMPNTIVVGYHGPSDGSDPFRNFQGNEISGLLNFFSYPSGIIDRTSTPISSDGWIETIQARQNIPATVDINIIKTFDINTRQLNLTVYITALQNLIEKHFINVVLVEDGLRANQTGNNTCTGGLSFIHNNVVRSMLNGALGDTLFNAPVNQGETMAKQFAFTIANDFEAGSSRIVVFVYKENATLSSSQIAQAEEYPLIGTIVPVELTTFTANINNNNIVLNWTTATELNNNGFEIEKSADGFQFEKCGFVKGAGSSTNKKDYSYTDKILSDRKTNYRYRLKQIDFNGKYQFSKVINVLYGLPDNISLSQNYPNPFNPITKIRYSIPSGETHGGASVQNILLKIYDVLGNEIATLVNEEKIPGEYEVIFNADGFSSGVYIYRLKVGDFTFNKRMSYCK